MSITGNPFITIINNYDNTYQQSNPITGNGYNVADAHDAQPSILVTLADASVVTIPAGGAAKINMTGAKAFSSLAQASSAPVESGGTVLQPTALQ